MNPCMDEINQAIDYIHKHIDASLSVEAIADHCCFSKFHFSRVFKSVVGESLYAFIKRLKLERAAFLLRTGNRSRTVTDIALETGYSPSNFATVFRDYFGVSATYYRRHVDVPIKDSYLSVKEHIRSMKEDGHFFEAMQSKIQIREMESMILEYERFIGNYYDLYDRWLAFCTRAASSFSGGSELSFVGISYDDPLTCDEDRCLYDMCVRVEKPLTPSHLRIDGGLHACYLYTGSQLNLSKAYNEIFALWLPYSRYQLDNKPFLEIYDSGPDTNGIMRVWLCIPVKRNSL